MKNLQEILAKLTILIRQRDNTQFWSGNVTTSTREPLTCAWIRADIWRQGGAICSTNRKNVPYHRCARILRLTVSIPDYGSWSYKISLTKSARLKTIGSHLKATTTDKRSELWLGSIEVQLLSMKPLKRAPQTNLSTQSPSAKSSYSSRCSGKWARTSLRIPVGSSQILGN